MKTGPLKVSMFLFWTYAVIVLSHDSHWSGSHLDAHTRTQTTHLRNVSDKHLEEPGLTDTWAIYRQTSPRTLFLIVL